MSPVIQIRDLAFRYARSGFALHIPDLHVSPGERLGLVGPSGCGKSTVLNLISGSLAADGGSLLVDGVELVGQGEAARRRHRLTRLGLVFQDFPLIAHLNALENVILPYRMGGRSLTAAVRTRASDLLDELGLADKHRRRPARLSQGERQRVALARALITQPTIILADEPTTGLDPERTQAVVDLLTDVCAERAVALVLVTHDQSVVARLDRAYDVGTWVRA